MAKTSCKKGQYYCNTDKKCKPIPDGYKVRDDGFLVSEGSNPRIPRKAGQPAKSKKHSDLYTDEDPKGTIHGLGFKDVATAKASVAKIRKSSRSHTHKIQAAIAMEQRARVMGKTSEAAVYRKFINSMKKKTKKMNEEKHGDHEPEMIRSQLKTAGRASKRIEKHSRKKDNFKAWVQSKITKASDYLDTAADYLDSKDVKEASSPAQQAAIAIDMKKKGKKPKSMSEGSLHKWFSGSKSKDGKGGWVNVTTGGTCASDKPGEGVPKCVSRSKYESMTPAERRSASRRKKAKDKGQQSKRNAAKPTYVATDKPKKKMKEEFISLPLQLEVPQNDGEFKLGLMFRESLEQDRGMLFIFENTDYHSFHMKNTFIPLDIAFINEEGIIESIKELNPQNPIPVYPDGEIRYAIEVNRGWFAENGVVVGDILLEDIQEHHKKDADGNTIPHEHEEELNEVKDRKGKGSGTKDACYHKVKSRYSVWPSAYASGALVKCRKVGAANWGNSKKEEVEYKGEDVQEAPMALPFIAKALGAIKGATMTKGGLFALGAGAGLGGALPAIVAPKTMITLAGLGAATQGAGVIKQTVRKQAADKENQNLRMRMGMGEEKSDWRQELDEKCWPGYEKKGMKTMFGKRYPNCVKKSKKKK